jgi:mannose/fructose/N-acetylgalactosamine-specific phosphotransferase system component IIC
VIGPAIFLGALAGLDRTAFGQTLFAHPLVVGSAALLFVGSSPDAFLLLAVLTCLDAPQIPVGPVRLRDWGSAAVVGVTLGTEASTPAGWALALLLGVGVAMVGGLSIRAVRNLALRAMPRVDRAIATGALAELEHIHLVLTALPALRGALVTAASLLVGRALFDRGLPAVAGASGEEFLSLIWRLAPWAALPVLCRLHWSRRRWIPAGLGALGGATLLALQLRGGWS